MQVAKWGNSLAIRLPAKLVHELELKEGDEVEIVKATADTLEVAKAKDRLEIISALRKYRERLPADYEFKRSDAYDDY